MEPPPDGRRETSGTIPAVRGYDSVMRVAQEHPRWLQTIRDCYDQLELQKVEGGTDHACAKWIAARSGRPATNLAPLARWGVLSKKKWGVVNGVDLDASGRVYYEMPDRAGVVRALDDLGV
jgi:hypothetical protein